MVVEVFYLCLVNYIGRPTIFPQNSIRQWARHSSTITRKIIVHIIVIKFLTIMLFKITIRKGNTYQYNECKYLASHKKNVQTHINAVHKQEKTYKCNECKYAASQLGHLRRHINAVHKQAKPYKCHECKYVSSTNKDQLFQLSYM